MSTATEEQPSTPPGRRTPLLVAAVVAVVVVLLAAAVWAFTTGPLSSQSRDEDAVAQAVTSLREADSLKEFNNRLCARHRAPEEFLTNIASAGEGTGTDIDRLFRESMLSSFPEDLEVVDVEVDGDSATVTTTSGGGSATEHVEMLREDGQWRVCQPGVGMGAVPGG